MKIYILTERVLKRLNAMRGENEVCYICGEPLEPNQRIISKKSTPKSRPVHSKRAHEACYLKQFLDV